MCASVRVVKLRPHLRATLSLSHHHFIAVARHSGNKIINISVSTDLSELKYGESTLLYGTCISDSRKAKESYKRCGVK